MIFAVLHRIESTLRYGMFNVRLELMDSQLSLPQEPKRKREDLQCEG